MISNQILNAIQSYECITIFRHENPDCDAVGSQFGLKTWIEENFPNKKVYALGTKDCTQGIWPMHDVVDFDVINNSLAIVLDTANQNRVDDQRFIDAKQIIKIDHHPNYEPFGDIVYVDEKSAATCQILTNFFQTWAQYNVSIKTASYLYAGLLTDTLNYTTSNTTKDTLLAGAYLAGIGVNVPAIGRSVFDRTYDEFVFAGYIRSHVTRIDEQFAYVRIDHDVLDEYHLSPSDARNFVDELGHIQEISIWAIFTERFDDDSNSVYDASLRSKTITINDIAQKYGGGGHKNACGIKNLSVKSLTNLIDDIIDKIHQMSSIENR